MSADFVQQGHMPGGGPGGVFAELALLPFAEQCARIDAEVQAGRDVPELLGALGQMRDHEPLAYAVNRLATHELLDAPQIAAALEEVIAGIPDTGIQRLLRSIEPARLAPEQRAVLVRCVSAVVRRLPIERLAAVCLMDRWLKNTAPAQRQEIVAEAAAQVLQAVRRAKDRKSSGMGERSGTAELSESSERSGTIALSESSERGGMADLIEIRDATLALVPGRELAAIGREDVPEGLREAWALRLDRFAARVLDLLEAAPKSLSQANAEELLSRRVYTDPGHFLVELLQNAEDAGARWFGIELDAEAATVRHDGIAFDAKDVVGVLSIGQTTKQNDQIGFFGVGFKSVYEICVRPQVYSGPFCFEIAEVSIPRRLRRPEGMGEGTMLVLRLRDPADPMRQPDALFARALAVPPETLLTLRNLRAMDVRFGQRSRHVHAEAGAAPGRMRLVLEYAAHAQHSEAREYLIASDRFAFTEQRRDAGRASETLVLVAIALDPHGAPIPVPADAPTVFCYLPTRERSGLRFLLHAHFDLPVDRERLDLDSAWNRWAIAKAGMLLARAAAELVAAERAAAERAAAELAAAELAAAEATQSAIPQLAGQNASLPEQRNLSSPCEQLLDVLPLASELAHPGYLGLIEALQREIMHTPLLPALAPHEPTQQTDFPVTRVAPIHAAVIEDAALARALAGVDLDGTGRRVLAPMTSRRREVALSLGAMRFGMAELLELLERTLAQIAEGTAIATIEAPWLEHGLGAILDALASAPASAAMDARLAALPLLVDQHGCLRRPGRVARADAALCAVYGSVRLFVRADIEQMPGQALDQTVSAHRAALLGRLGVRTLGAGDLVRDLRDPELGPAIARHDANAMLGYLAGLPRAQIAGLGALALFPAVGANSAVTVAAGLQAAERWPLTGHNAAWLLPVAEEPMAGFLAAMQGDRPALIDTQLGQAHRSLLITLGARVLDLPALLELVAAPEPVVRMTQGDLRALHRAIQAMRADFTPRLCTALCTAAIFPDANGRLRPLVGAERALITEDPGDREVALLAPDAPWLDAEIAALSYVRELGANGIGPARIAAELAASRHEWAGSQELRILDLEQPGCLRRVYAYLAARASRIPVALTAALAEAPVWLDEHGGRHALAMLRLPAEEPAIAAVYAAWAAWGRFPLIETSLEPGEAGGHGKASGVSEVSGHSEPGASGAGISALELARALGLGRMLEQPSYGRLVMDVASVATAEHAAEIARIRPILAPALHAAAAELPRAQLARLEAAALFRAQGAPEPLHCLRRWSEPLERPGVARARGPLCQALSLGSRPILASEDEELFAPLLAALAIPLAEIADLTRAVLGDSAFAAAPARHAARAALVAVRTELGPHCSPELLDDLQRLPIWPTVDQRLLSAGSVVRGRELAQVMAGILAGEPGSMAMAGAHAVLDPAAEADADALVHVIGFADPIAAVRAAVMAQARANQPLSAQPAFLDTPEKVAEIARLLAGAASSARIATTAPIASTAPMDFWARLGSLPLVVDATGCLVSGPRYQATADELAIATHLPILGQLAHPTWAAIVQAPLKPLGTRQLIAALAEAARTPQPLAVQPGRQAGQPSVLSGQPITQSGQPDTHSSLQPDSHANTQPFLATTAERNALYRWLLEHAEAIATDDQARGVLGRACIIATAGGFLRAPRDLLLDPELPDLGADWNAASEIPAPLVAWLRRTFAMDDRRLAPLVEHLLTVHEQAARERDIGRSTEILGFLARSLRLAESPAEAENLAQRFKLRKRLRVAGSDGEWARPRALMAPAPARWELITGFAAQPPARVSPAYTSEPVRALICLAGAAAELDAATLLGYLTEIANLRKPGLDADLALARYLAERATEEPGLRQELGLAKRSWIPSHAGTPCRPDQLYWPDGEAVAVIGQDPARFPHPRFVHTAPPGLGRWLPFRTAADAALSDVAAHIRAMADRGDSVSAEILDWLERGLHTGSLDATEVREHLAQIPFLTDDDGRPRIAADVVREGAAELFGQRMGSFGAGARYPRLCAALKIAKRPGKREILRYFEMVAGELDTRSAAEMLAEEPELLDRLPRCLAMLAASGGHTNRKMPLVLPLVVEDTRGEPTLCMAPHPRLFLRSPAELADMAADCRAPVLFPRIDLIADDEGAVHALLALLGISDLLSAPPATVDTWPAELRAAIRQWHARAAETEAEAARARNRDAANKLSPQAANKLSPHAAKAAASQASPEATRPKHPDSADSSAPDREPDSHRDASDEPREPGGMIGRLRRWLTGNPEDAEQPRPQSGNRSERQPEKPKSRPASDAPARGRQSHQSSQSPQGRPGDHGRQSPQSSQSSGAGQGSGRGGTPDHRQWFRPRKQLGPQLGDNTAWAADRQQAASFGVAFAPHSLPAPYLYGVHTLFDRFEPGAQRWLSSELPAEWSQPAAQGRYQVHVRGRMPAGEVLLPMPAYARVEAVSASGQELEPIAARDGRLVILAPEDSTIEYTAILDQAPGFEDLSATEPRISNIPDIQSAPSLLVPTVPDDELPAEVHATLDRIAEQSLTPLARALAVRDFIRERYYYDSAYIEDPTLGQWLRNVSRGRGNAHIAAMHAGRDASYLGRGVCYELNSLACELLRRVGIPAAIATGWTFDRGYIDEPDHLWAMALLPTPVGLRWLPLDASTTRDGRPLHAGRRPPGPWRASAARQSAPPPRSPAWARQAAERRYESPGRGRGGRGASGSAQSSDQAPGDSVPIGDLVRVIRYLERMTDQPASSDTAALRRRCRELLANPATAAALLDALNDSSSRGDDGGGGS